MSTSDHLQHVALIMDGNRRWAETHHLPRLAGHAKGVETLKALVRHAANRHIPYLTVYAFSTENWQRTAEEVGYLMTLFVQSLSKELQELHKEGVKLRFIGAREAFPKEMQNLLKESETLTQANQRITLHVALNYGSRAEIVHAAQHLAKQVQAGSLSPEAITETLFNQTLYTQGCPDPDLLIRTGGDSRLSNYLLWQLAYTELWITPTLWPDFSPEAFDKALAEFTQRNRRFGR